MELDKGKTHPQINTGSMQISEVSAIKHFTLSYLAIKKIPEQYSSIVLDDFMPEMYRFMAELLDINTESMKENLVISQIGAGILTLVNKLTQKDGEFVMDSPPLMLSEKMKKALDEFLIEPLLELVDDKKGASVQGMIQGLGSDSHFTQKVTKITKETDESK